LLAFVFLSVYTAKFELILDEIMLTCASRDRTKIEYLSRVGKGIGLREKNSRLILAFSLLQFFAPVKLICYRFKRQFF